MVKFVRAVLLAAQLLLFGGSGCIAATLPTDQAFQDWLHTSASRFPELQIKIRDVNESYEIVFVPGILGSQLKIADFTYGKDPITADKLVFTSKPRPEQRPEAHTLNEFTAHIGPLFKNVDIYGVGLNQLQAANGGRPPVEFAYDWRDDLEQTARAFNDVLLPFAAKNKKFVIVAHSMGGVVAWHWKNIYNDGASHRNLLGIAILGSPLLGSCEPIRMLIEGYSEPPQKSGFEKWATHLVFGKARPAIATFPSVFQLLPSFDKQHPCVKIRRGDVEQTLDHHEVGAWLGREGGDYGLDPSFAREAKLDFAEYRERVTEAITRGRAFRIKFNSAPTDDQVYLLYTGKYPIASGFTVRPNGSAWLALDKSWAVMDADGRVPRESATNRGQFDAKHGAIVELDKEHGDLLNDPKFARFVEANIARLIAQAKQIEIFQFASEHPELKAELRGRGWLADIDVSATSLRRVPAISAATQQLAVYNFELLTTERPDSRLVGIDFSKLTPSEATLAAGKLLDAAGDEQTAVALYSTSIVLDPDKVDAVTFRKLGTAKARLGQWSEAASYFHRAVEALNRPDVKPDRGARGSILHDLGSAYENAGSLDQAVGAYEYASAQGNAAAQGRIEQLKKSGYEATRFNKDAVDKDVGSRQAGAETLKQLRDEPMPVLKDVGSRFPPSRP